jgi:hypothetical protein
MRRRHGRIDFAPRRASGVSRADAIMFFGSPNGFGGARSPGVRQRRRLARRELDVSERIRATIEARRGGSTGPTFWRT